MGSVPVPPIDFLLQYKFWELHEAAFILSNRWPRDLCYNACRVPPWLRAGRNAFLAPRTKSGYCPKELGKEFQKALALLERGLLSGEIVNNPANLYLSCYGANRTFLIPPIEALTLGVMHDLILPEELAENLGIEQIKEEKKPRNLLKFTVDQTIAQFILHREEIGSISTLCRHDLMKRFGSAQDSCDVELKSIRRSLAFLSRIEKTFNSFLAPLQAVKRERAFRFSLLKEVIKTITLLVIDSIGTDQMGRYTEGELIQVILSSPVLLIYLQDVSHFVKILATHWCSMNLLRYYSDEKIQDMPAEVRRNLKINELKYINMRLILNHFHVTTLSSEETGFVAPLLDGAKKLEGLVDPDRLPFIEKFFLEGNRV